MLRRLVAAILPAALLCSYATAQTPERAAPTRNAAPATTLNLAGPDGTDALTVTKQAPRQIRAGQAFDYTITVKNPGKSAAQGVTVYEELTGLTIRKADVQGGTAASNDGGANAATNGPGAMNGQGKSFKKNGDVHSYKLGDLAAGESRTITVSAVAAAPAAKAGNNAAAAGNAAAAKGQQAKSCLWVDYNPTLCSTFEIVQPDFRLTAVLRMYRDLAVAGQQEDVGGAYRCDRVVLETQMTSTGDAATAPATVMLDLPKGVMTADGKNQLKMDVGALQPGKAIDKKTELKLDPSQAAGQLKLVATATAGDLKAEVDLPAVKILDPKLDLKVEGGGEQYIGRPAGMKVTVSNPGQDPVLDARVHVTQPAGGRFAIDGADRDGMITIGRLNAGESRTFDARLESRKAMTADVLVKADAYCVAAIEKKANVVLKGIPAILLEVVDKKDPVPVGEETVYEIAVKNQGTAVDNNVMIKVTLPASESFVEAHGATQGKANGETVTFAKVPAVQPGEVVSWTVRVKANEADKAKFKVELTSDANKDAVIEQEPTTLY